MKHEVSGSWENINKHSFLLLATAAGSLLGFTEITDSFIFFLSSVHRVQLGTEGPQVVMALASLGRKIKCSCKSNCHFCLPWQKELSWDSSSNETVKYGGRGLYTTSEAVAKPGLLGTHTTLPGLGLHLEGWVFGTVGPDSEEVQIDIVAFWSHVNSIALGRVYLRNWTLGRPCLWVRSSYPQSLSEEKNSICIDLCLSFLWSDSCPLRPVLIYCQAWRFVFLILSHS